MNNIYNKNLVDFGKWRLFSLEFMIDKISNNSVLSKSQGTKLCRICRI